jgi:hypothetical protein
LAAKDGTSLGVIRPPDEIAAPIDRLAAKDGTSLGVIRPPDEIVAPIDRLAAKDGTSLGVIKPHDDNVAPIDRLAAKDDIPPGVIRARDDSGGLPAKAPIGIEDGCALVVIRPSFKIVGGICGQESSERILRGCNPFIAPTAEAARGFIPPLGTVSNGSKTEGTIQPMLLGLNFAADKLLMSLASLSSCTLPVFAHSMASAMGFTYGLSPS